MWRGAAVVAGVYALAGAATTIAPGLTLQIAAKEGLLEQLSHAVLVVGIAAWVLRARTPPRWVPILVAVALTIVLAEELDWGGLFGMTAVSNATGLENFHNSWGGASYLLFAIPFAGFFALPFTRYAHLGPSRAHTLSFGVVAVAALASTAADPIWEGAVDELNETLAYVIVAVAGRRRE